MITMSTTAWRLYFERNCGVTMPSADKASTTIGSSKLTPNVSTMAKMKLK